MMKRILAPIVALLIAGTAYISAQASPDYYKSIDGVKGGKELKTLLFNLIKDMRTVEYGSGVNATWGAFYTTDAVPENSGQVADMYSSEKRYFGSKGESVDGMNIEHCVPKSWWGGTQINAYYDLHHLNPSDQVANSKKNNYPLAELNSVTWTNGVSSIGKAKIAGTNQNAYEPADEYKGDFARAYMYIFTCYQNVNWKYTWMVYENSDYPTLKPWAVELLMKWHREDPVSKKEVERNNAVYAIQGNRNPYIDYPRLADFVWGDSVDYTFHLYGGMEDGSGNQAGSGGAGGEVVPDGGDDNGSGDISTVSGFYLVKDVEELVIGDTLLLVYENAALGKTQNSNNRASAPVETNAGRVVSLSDEAQLIVLERGAVEGSYALRVDGGYLYAASSSSNYLRTRSGIDANASWKITIDEGVAEIAAQGDKTRNLLQYNSSADLFSCYKSGQKSINIYVKERVISSIDVLNDEGLPMDIYNMDGVCVGRGVTLAEARKILPTGIYLIGKKKYYIK